MGQAHESVWVPVWSYDGISCTGETYPSKVKITFAKGARLDEPGGLFNASLNGNARRAIELREGEAIDEEAFVVLVRAAVDPIRPTTGAEPVPLPRRTGARAALRMPRYGRCSPMDRPRFVILALPGSCYQATDAGCGHRIDAVEGDGPGLVPEGPLHRQGGVSMHGRPEYDLYSDARVR